MRFRPVPVVMLSSTSYRTWSAGSYIKQRGVKEEGGGGWGWRECHMSVRLSATVGEAFWRIVVEQHGQGDMGANTQARARTHTHNTHHR